MSGAASALRASPRYWEHASKESNVSEFVSIGAPVTPHDTVTRAGDSLNQFLIPAMSLSVLLGSMVSKWSLMAIYRTPY